MTTKLDGRSGTTALIAELDLLGHHVSTGDIVVGAEYGVSGYHALRWAALIAQVHRRRLRIVRIVRDVDWLLDPRPAEELIAAGDHLGRAVLEDKSSMARSMAPDIEIRARLLRGSLYALLMSEAESAGLLVLGDDDHAGAARDHSERPVAGWFIQNAPCPVLVVDRVGHEVGDG